MLRGRRLFVGMEDVTIIRNKKKKIKSEKIKQNCYEVGRKNKNARNRSMEWEKRKKQIELRYVQEEKQIAIFGTYKASPEHFF